MTIGISNALASAQTQALAAMFNGGFIRLFSGARPSSPDQAESGTLLGIITSDGQPGAGLQYQSSGATLTKSNSPWVFSALADGTVTWFRIVEAADSGADDLSANRIDGDVGLQGTGSDMTWQNTTVANGVTYTLDAFVYLIQPVGK